MASASSSIVSTSSQLPTSSTSPPPPLTLWDVFISFRGIDTRYTFTDHLYEALQRTGIRTFMDDPELRRGDVISNGLIQAIQNSKVYVVVFSKNYASSTWCLDELVEILNCHKTMQKLVIPVYHNIDSSVVRHQTKSFKSAFKKHESRPKLGFFRRVSKKDTFQTAAKLEQIEKWRHTLSEVAGFSGQTITAQRNEADIVDEIVEKILIEINPITLHVAKYPVGLDSHVENITALMSSHPGVTKIGIYGMGGVGKTTLAKAVYNQNYRRFQGSCFLQNVRESSVTTRGLVCLQQQLIDNVLKCKNINIDNVNHGIELIRARISSIKVLIVFDDLDDPRSMEFLEGKFALGSIILITTRNEDLLDLINVEAKYKVNELGDAESRQLFAQHAFGDNKISYTSTKSFEEILEHAGGLPLALEVFGSNLLNQSEESWTHFSDELKQVSLDVVERKLMISFDALKSVDPMLQDIFLDIACFFMGWNVEEVVKIMETCYTFLSHNIDILKKRSLLTINNRDELGMHVLLRNMGRKIVRNSSPNEPGKHSRLWVSKDICHVLKKHLGTEAIKGIISSNFNHQDALEGVSFNTETFQRMSKLRFLKLNKVKLFGSFEQKFGNLRWLCWDGCPLKYLPLEFYPQKLVILELPHSKIVTMGKLNKVFEKLKTLNMKHSLDLTSTPNFNQFPHLEALNFEHCESLEEVHMSIGSLERLVILNLHGCVNLRSLPGSICNLRALKSLNIGGCISLKELPIELGNLESLRELNAEHLTVVKLPDSIGRLSKLVELGLNHNKNLKTLPDSICNLRSLNSLHIAGCSGLEELPKELGKIESLTKLNAWGLTVSKLPDSINCLSKLVELNLNDNKYLEIPPSSLSASGSAPTNRDVLSLREKAKVNDLINGNKKASEGGSAARKFTYSEVPLNCEMTSNKQVKFSDTISSIEMDDPDMEGQQIGRDPSANWSSRNSPYTTDDHITSYSPYLPPVLEEPSSSFSKDDDPLPAVEGLQISGEPYPGQISEMGVDVANFADPAPAPSTRAVKVHSRMCTELMKLVASGTKLLPQIEAARPGGTSGLQALCLLSNAIEKAKLIIEDCCHSSKLYLAITGDVILSRCEKVRKSFVQSLSQIQYVVPIILASEISHIISDINGATLVLDPSEEVAGKVMKNLLQQYSSATYSIEESAIQSLQMAASRLHITSPKSILIEKRSIKRLLDKVGDSAPPKKRILIFLLNYLKKYEKSIARGNLDNAYVEHENFNLFARSHEQYIEMESRTTYIPAEAQMDMLSRAIPPEEFRCPLSSRIMYDPVVIDSGETFERMFIQKWFSEGHNTCPKTKKKLAHLSLTPNVMINNLISRWCTAYGVTILDPFMQSEAVPLQESSLNSIASLSDSMCNLSLPTDFSSVSIGYSDTSLNSESSFDNMPDRNDSVFLKRSGDSETSTRNANNHFTYTEHLQKLDSLTWESQWKMVDDYKIHLKNDSETIQFASEENFVEPLIKFLEKARDLNDVKALRAGCLLLLEFATKSGSGGQCLNEGVYVLLASFFYSEVATEALCIIEVLSHYQYCRTKIAASGVISSIIRVLEVQIRELYEPAIRILYNLSLDNEIQAYIVATDFICKLVPYFEDSSLARYCITILKSLCNHEAIMVSVAETDGCIASIARMLEMDSTENQEHAVDILLSLCSQRDRYCQLVMDEGVIPSLVSISINGNERGKASAMELLRLFRDVTDNDNMQETPESDKNILRDSDDDIKEHEPSPKPRGFFKKIIFSESVPKKR